MRKSIMAFLQLSLLVAVAALFAPWASAQAADPTIAVLNIQEIMRQSKAAQSVRKQLESKQQQFQQEMGTKEEALQKEDQELAKQRSLLSPEAFQEKVEKFRNKATAMQKDVRSKKSQLDKAFGQALSDIQKAVHDIVEDIAKQKGLQLVVPTSQLLYADPALDISEEVQKKLDQKLPDIKLDFSAATAG